MHAVNMLIPIACNTLSVQAERGFAARRVEGGGLAYIHCELSVQRLREYYSLRKLKMIAKVNGLGRLVLAWVGLTWLGLAGSIQNKKSKSKNLKYLYFAQPLTPFGCFCFLLCEGFGRYTCEGFYVALHILVRRFSIGFLFG
jgi:hypothetical protein